MDSTGIAASVRKTLFALSDSFERGLDAGVAELAQEARELETTVRRYGTELLGKSQLDKRILESLASRREWLERAESEWAAHRAALLSRDFVKLREEGESLKKNAIAALRYFLRGNDEAQARIDHIVEGTGLADLVEDLGSLAGLLEEWKAKVAKADLPKNAAKRARELAALLGQGAADEKTDVAGADAKTLRNRAFWFLREAMEEVRAAGRYVYRANPKMLSLFRASSTRSRGRGKSKKSDPAPPAAAASGG